MSTSLLRAVIHYACGENDAHAMGQVRFFDWQSALPTDVDGVAVVVRRCRPRA
jgi:hypothetical protein